MTQAGHKQHKPALLERLIREPWRRVWNAVDNARKDGPRATRWYLPLYALRVLAQVTRQWARDRCPQQAASLAFQTVLSLVPLIAVALAGLRTVGSVQARTAFVEALSEHLFPISHEQVSEQLLSWSEKLTFANTGLPGVVFSLVLAFILYSTLERVFNDIWRADRRRNIAQRFIVFYALATIVPALIGVSLYHAARYGSTGLGKTLAALGATWLALFFANFMLPATRVKWAPAAFGALLSAVLFELAKVLFHAYIANLVAERYAGIYGALWLLPVLLIWIYYSWLVVLFGAEVAHAVDNLQDLERQDRRLRQTATEVDQMVSGRVAARILCALVESWQRGDNGMRRSQLSDHFDLGEDVVDRILRRLKDSHLIVSVQGDDESYVPARPPSSIKLSDVLAPFRGPDILHKNRRQGKSPLDETIDSIETAISGYADQTTFEDLTQFAGKEGA